jgi:hypothetical protein
VRGNFEPVEQDIALTRITFNDELDTALRTSEAEAHGILLGGGTAEAYTAHATAAHDNANRSSVAVIRSPSDCYRVSPRIQTGPTEADRFAVSIQPDTTEGAGNGAPVGRANRAGFHFGALYQSCGSAAVRADGAFAFAQCDVGTATALIALGRHDLVIMTAAQTHAILRPGTRVVTKGDRSARSLVIPNTPELLKRLCTVNRGLVGAGTHAELVGTAVASSSAVIARARGRIVIDPVFNNVVLDQRASSPAVERQITGAVGAVAAGVAHGSVG